MPAKKKTVAIDPVSAELNELCNGLGIDPSVDTSKPFTIEDDLRELRRINGLVFQMHAIVEKKYEEVLTRVADMIEDEDEGLVA